MNQVLIWLGYVLLIVLTFVLSYYLYLAFLRAKDWILSFYDTLYEYFLSLFSTLQEVYDFVVAIPEIVAGFCRDILDVVVDGATDWFEDATDWFPF
jgi:hypothetical protein